MSIIANSIIVTVTSVRLYGTHTIIKRGLTEDLDLVEESYGLGSFFFALSTMHEDGLLTASQLEIIAGFRFDGEGRTLNQISPLDYFFPVMVDRLRDDPEADVNKILLHLVELFDGEEEQFLTISPNSANI